MRERERETERIKRDLLYEFEIEDQYSVRPERERERKRDSPSCERQRADKTHARDESTEARFPRLLLLLPAASGGAFKRTLANCTLDGRNFSAGVVVSRKVTLWFES